MIITIDGPAGAGKSTVTRLLAQRTGFQCLDTGAMYRAVTWAAMQRQIDFEDPQRLAKLVRQIKLRIDANQIFVDNHDVTHEIRCPEVTRRIQSVADNVEVRSQLVALQRQIAATGNYVCEGRDQGTVAFPNADCKIFLTASATQRALRRQNQLLQQGQTIDLQTILEEQQTRDHQDSHRPVGRLVKADDAIEVDTDHKSIDDVVTELLQIVAAKIKLSSE